MRLVDFLRARLDEDEASVLSGDCRCNDGPKRPDCPDRVLAEVGAKRRIIEHVATPTDVPGWRDTHAEMMVVLCLLALPYADHPDYDLEWRS